MLDQRKPGFRPDDPLRALGIRAPAAAPVAAAVPPPRLDDPTRTAIATALMAGESPASVVAGLVKSGVSPVLARAEVEQAAPYVAAGGRMARRIAKRDWTHAIHARLEAAEGPGVPRRDRLAPEDFFRDHWCRHRPVVLTGLVDHWPAMARWSLDHLARLVPAETQVEVQTGRAADADYELNSVAHKTMMAWGAVLDRLRADPTTNEFYITANNGTVNRKALAPIWTEIGPLPGYLTQSRMGDGFFWMGPRGTVTPWHHDLTQNLLMNVVGVKRVRLVSSSQTPLMKNHVHCFSEYGAATDLPREIRVETVDIGPGEILFIPVGWWHHVEGMSLTMGLSFTNFVWDNAGFEADYRANGEM
jgi:hypothetical protein